MGKSAGWLLVAAFASGCTDKAPVLEASLGPVPLTSSLPPAPAMNPALDQLPQAKSRPLLREQIVHGTGAFVGTARTLPTASPPGAYGDAVTLDFANADVRDVVRSVLGDLLKVPYAIDPAAQGNVTLQTGGPVPRGSVLSHLESALRLGGLGLVDSDGLYRIVPLAQAVREVRLSQGTQSGFVARVITPRYVAAADLERLLQPLVPVGTTLRAEPSRNVLIVSGPAADVTNLLDNLNVFDVDVLRGMSTALIPLKVATAKDVAKDVSALLASLGESGQLVRVTPLDRLNAILVTSMRPDYIDRVQRWVAGFDKANDVAAHHIFVYRIQNGRAADLAAVLRKTFGIGGDEAGTRSTGQSASAASSHDALGQSLSTGGDEGASAGGTASSNPLLGGIATGEPGAGSAGGFGTPDGPMGKGMASGQQSSDVRITADEANNALLIMASQEEYNTIEAALRELDIAPLQVMVETTVAEITLTDQLTYGLQYYLKSGNFQALFAQPASGGTTTAFTGFPFASGLNVAAGAATGSSVILQALQQLTNVRVLSSPNLLVLNNQSARIQVGDQVPIATGSAVSTISSNAPIVNSIEYRDTGIILKVTPRVNAGGMVALDVSEEVSSVSTTSTSSINSPTISERRLDTTVSVTDGQTVALGGLISDSRTKSTNGIPYLQNIPGLGWLFGQKSNVGTRTELIAILTPHVVRSGLDAQLVTEELQRKMAMAIPLRASVP